jgi:uncharacterized protein (TIGR00251 family)
VISDAPDGAIIDIKVIPRAGRTQLAGTRDNAILIRLAAAPVEGAANDALIAYLSDLLDIPKRNVIIVAGDKSRTKRIKVLGLSATAIRARMEALGGK